MKSIIKLLAAVLGVFLIFSCQDKIEESYKINSPVYMSYSDLRSSFKVAGAEDIIKPGKIYFKDNFIFVNEYMKGIHVINNLDPKEPKVVKFIEIPGNVDMAIKGDKLYADSYVDLLTIDISDMDNIRESDRDTNVFPYVLPEAYPDGPVDYIEQTKGVVVGFELIEKTEEIKTSPYYDSYKYSGWAENSTAVRGDVMMTSSGSPSVVSTSGIGVGGSMARFTLYNDVLYLIDQSNVKIFDVEDAANPYFVKEVYINWGIETLFPYEDKLFIGSTSGMIVYSLKNPLEPTFISNFSHLTACDPVVVEGDYAYVTLRGGNLCGAISSQLDVIDISKIESPQLIKTYPMDEPYGLGIDSTTLFVCDGSSGLKIYNAADPYKISQNLLVAYPNINAFDVIPLGKVLVMIGIDGLYQYSYDDVNNIQQLSHIPIYTK